jgi:5,10-methylenetetrahydromethanopterin reductase
MSPRHIEIAEKLGYRRAWIYDTPQQSPDVWVTLALAAQRTSRIGIGPGVLVPSLRHPMVNATATRTLQTMAPGRLAVAFGTGFTGRAAMGMPPLTWRYMTDYIDTYKRLLEGDTVTWKGAALKMLPPAEVALEIPALPPILLGALGPKGAQCARELGVDGILAFGAPPAAMTEYGWGALVVTGTVLDDDEDFLSPRVRDAAGHAMAINYHFSFTIGGADAVQALPGGKEWLDIVMKTDAAERHLTVHEGHLMRLNAADHAAWEAGGSVLLDVVTATGSPSKVAERIEELVEAGATEIVYQPAGPDIPRELSTFIDAVQCS